MEDKYVVLFADANSIEKSKELENKEAVLKLFKEKFKELKFLKNKQTWKKDTGELTFICNVQNSQWSKNDYYINVGILVNKLSALPHGFGTVDERIDLTGSENEIFDRVICWFNKYDSVEKLIVAAQNQEFPEIYSKRIIENLSK